MEENPANHLGCIKPVVNNGINYQPQLVCRISSINSSSETIQLRYTPKVNSSPLKSYGTGPKRKGSFSKHHFSGGRKCETSRVYLFSGLFPCDFGFLRRNLRCFLIPNAKNVQFLVNVGKYTGPMDAMGGYGLFLHLLGGFNHFCENFYPQRLWEMMPC